MKKITLMSMELLNFKGTRQRTIKFDTSVTNIFGHNRTGKTTILDAYLWLWFGKDSTDRKDFEIKTLDDNNEAYHKLSHEVTATFDIDGDPLKIRRSYKEKWPTKKGEAVEMFTGHETSLYWNDVPMQLKDFTEKVSGIMAESLFKLVSNTGYFNALPWEKRRSALEQIAGTITNDMVFDTLHDRIHEFDYAPLINALNANKSLSEFRRQIAAQKKLIQDQKEAIPNRIDEVKRSYPDAVDYAAIESQMDSSKQRLTFVEGLLNDFSLQLQTNQQELSKKANEVQSLSSKKKDIENGIRNSIDEKRRNFEGNLRGLRRDLADKNSDRQRNDRDIQQLTKRVEAVTIEKEKVGQQWDAVDSEQLVFKDGEFKCPACDREIAADKMEEKKLELSKNFNQSKSTRLNDIVVKGQGLAADIKTSETKIQELKNANATIDLAIQDLTTKIQEEENAFNEFKLNSDAAYNEAIRATTEHAELSARIALLNAEIQAPIASNSTNTELTTERQQLSISINGFNRQLATKEQKEKLDTRIEELSKQQSEMAAELARMEGIEFTIGIFEKSKMDMLESRVNSMFQVVKFKMFQTNINGGEEPCCITLVNGVPYSDINTASKIQAGIDIINTLSKFYKVSAPIFIDNRESVIDIPDSNSQIINLIVSEKDSTIRIEHKAA